MYVDGCGDVLYSSLSSFLGILKKALGDRVTNIATAPTYRQKVLCGVQIGSCLLMGLVAQRGDNSSFSMSF